MNPYTVSPFSGPRYRDNKDRCPADATPCAICGKPMVAPWKHEAVVINGGASWGDEHSDINDPGWMGTWPIGNDCHRKYSVGAK